MEICSKIFPNVESQWMFLTENKLKNLGRKLELILKVNHNIKISAVAGNQEKQTIVFFVDHYLTDNIPKNFRNKKIKIVQYEIWEE